MPKYPPGISTYRVKWYVTGHKDQVITSQCLVEDGYSTVRDIPKMLELRYGFDRSRIVVVSKTKIGGIK